MLVTLLLNFRGYEQKTYQNTKYYRYYFENSNGVPVQFSSNELMQFERGKDYKLNFECSKLYFRGIGK